MRYIDADKIVITAERGRSDDGLIFIPMIDVHRSIDATPTADVVEVVRCKDCKYRYVPCRCALWYATVDDKEYFAERGEDFYCSYGKRKGERNV